MSVNTYLYIAIMAALLCPTASCSKNNGMTSDAAADSISAMAREGSFKGIQTLRTCLLSDYDDSFRDDVYNLFCDSTLDVSAMALYATHTVNEVADSIFAHHAVDLSHAVFRFLAESGDTSSVEELKTAITQRFNAMDLDEKARWIVTTLKPSEIAQYLDNSDAALIQRIMALYNGSDRTKFVASIKALKITN